MRRLRRGCGQPGRRGRADPAFDAVRREQGRGRADAAVAGGTRPSARGPAVLQCGGCGARRLAWRAPRRGIEPRPPHSRGRHRPAGPSDRARRRVDGRTGRRSATTSTSPTWLARMSPPSTTCNTAGRRRCSTSARAPDRPSSRWSAPSNTAADARRARLTMAPRRPGDVAAIWADSSEAQRVLGWHARFGIAEIAASAVQWAVRRPDGYPDARRRRSRLRRR